MLMSFRAGLRRRPHVDSCLKRRLDRPLWRSTPASGPSWNPRRCWPELAICGVFWHRRPGSNGMFWLTAPGCLPAGMGIGRFGVLLRDGLSAAGWAGRDPRGMGDHWHSRSSSCPRPGETEM